MYDNYQKKNVQGYLNSNKDKTEDSNSQKKTYWDKDFLNTSWSVNNSNWSITGNKWFEIQVGNDTLRYINDSTSANQNFNISNVVNKNFANWMMFNNMMNKTVIKLPLTQTDRTLINASSIPIIGKLWSMLTFGLAGAGWNVTNEAPPVYPYFNFLMPANLYDSLISIWAKYIINDDKDKTSKGNGNLGLETFYGTNDSTIGIMTGGNASTIAFCGSLTHMVTMNYINKTGKGGSQTIAFSDHGQEHWSNNGYYFAVNENTNLQPANKTNDNPNYPTGIVRGYCIDFYELLALGDSSYQVKFFSLAGWNSAYNEAISDDNCVWIGTFESRAKLTNNIREFRNTYQMSDPTFEFKQKFNYPRDLSPIPPANIDIYTLNEGDIKPAKNICSPDYTYTANFKPYLMDNTYGQDYMGFNVTLNKKDTNPAIVDFKWTKPSSGYKVNKIIINKMNISFKSNTYLYTRNARFLGESDMQYQNFNFYREKTLYDKSIEINIDPVTKKGTAYWPIPFNAWSVPKQWKTIKVNYKWPIGKRKNSVSNFLHDGGSASEQLFNKGLFIKFDVDLNTKKIKVSQTNYNENFSGGYMILRQMFGWVSHSAYFSGLAYKAEVNRYDIDVYFNDVSVEYIK